MVYGDSSSDSLRTKLTVQSNLMVQVCSKLVLQFIGWPGWLCYLYIRFYVKMKSEITEALSFFKYKFLQFLDGLYEFFFQYSLTLCFFLQHGLNCVSVHEELVFAQCYGFSLWYKI